MKHIATFVRQLDGFQGDARLFKCDPPIAYDFDWETDKPTKKSDHVVVSAVNAMITGPETYIFPADEEGDILNWSELDGSFRGSFDHEQALRNAGYTVS